MSGIGITPGLEAGAARRRLAGFRPGRAHLNTLITSVGRTVLARARWLARNTAFGPAAVRVFAASAAGEGIVPSWRVDSPRLRERGQQLWLDWTDEADAENDTDFYGLQALVAEEVFQAGECFVRFVARSPDDGLSVPLQVQVLPSEMLPIEHTEFLSGGRMIRCGIEFDAAGRRLAYHFLRRHPGDSTEAPDGALTVRVPAQDVMHVIRRVEAGQIRGLSMLAPAVVRLFMVDAYNDAELNRKLLAASLTGFIKRPALEETDGITGAQADAAGTATGTIQPGQFPVLEPGEDVEFAEPAEVGGSYEAFQYRVALEISAATGIPYAMLTGDLRQTSYASQRAGLVQFRREIGMLQHRVFVYQLCRPVWRRWLETAITVGALRAPGYTTRPRDHLRVRWITPRWEWVDPKKDREAEKLAVDAGFKSRSAVIEAEGYDPVEVDAQIAADRARERDLGLSFTSAAASPVSAEELDPEDASPREEPPAEPVRAVRALVARRAERLAPA